jgi:hypothetical protein
MALPTLFQMRFFGRNKKAESPADGELANMRSRMRERLPEAASLSELFSALAEDDRWDVELPAQFSGPRAADRLAETQPEPRTEAGDQ